MGKKRINITVDEWVKDELDRQEDINVSGAANEFFKHYLSGENTDRVAKELRIKQLKEREEEAQENAQQYRAEWQTLKQELEEETAEEQEIWSRALSMLRFNELSYDNSVSIESPDEAVQDFADDLGMDVEAFRTELIKRYKEQ